MGRKGIYQETETIRELAAIMAKGGGPFTRKMLAEQLSELHPTRYYQELMNDIFGAIIIDRYVNKRFKTVSHGWYALADKKD